MSQSNLLSKSYWAEEYWTAPKMLAVALCFIDESYQRSLDRSRVRKMAENWKPHLAKPVTVSKRLIDGKIMYAVIDGQHRFEAMKLIDPDGFVAAFIRVDMSVPQEASYFADMGNGTRPLGVKHRFRAAYAAQEKSAVDIVNAVEQAGFYVDGINGSGLLKGLQVPANVAIELGDPAKGGSPELIKEALSFLGGHWRFLAETNRALNGALIDAIARIVQQGTEAQVGQLSTVLSRCNQIDVEHFLTVESGADARNVARGSMLMEDAIPGGVHGMAAKKGFRMALIRMCNQNYSPKATGRKQSTLRKSNEKYMDHRNFR